MEGPLFVSLSFSICTGLSNRMPPSHWLLAPVRDRMLNKGPGMIDDVIQQPLFLSLNWEGRRGRGEASIDGYHSENTQDKAVIGAREASERKENRKVTTSASVSGTQVKQLSVKFLFM